MDKLLVITWFYVSVAVGQYITTTAHEFGHALVALRKTRGDVLVLIGSPERLITSFVVGRVQVGIGIGWGGAYMAEDVASSRDETLITAGGPAASALMAVLATGALIQIGAFDAPQLPGISLGVLVFLNVWAVCRSLQPRIVPSEESTVGIDIATDGLQIARALGWSALEPDGPVAEKRTRPWAVIALVVVAVPALAVGVLLSVLMLVIAASVWWTDIRPPPSAPTLSAGAAAVNEAAAKPDSVPPPSS